MRELCITAVQNIEPAPASSAQSRCNLSDKRCSIPVQSYQPLSSLYPRCQFCVYLNLTGLHYTQFLLVTLTLNVTCILRVYALLTILKFPKLKRILLSARWTLIKTTTWQIGLLLNSTYKYLEELLTEWLIQKKDN